MLRKALLTKQIYLTVDDEVGVLNRIADYLSDRGLNIEAVAAYEGLYRAYNRLGSFVEGETGRKA